MFKIAKFKILKIILRFKTKSGKLEILISYLPLGLVYSMQQILYKPHNIKPHLLKILLSKGGNLKILFLVVDKSTTLVVLMLDLKVLKTIQG